MSEHDGRPVAPNAPSVALFASEHDRSVADDCAAYLRSTGYVVVTDGEATGVEAVIVVLSTAALDDPDWTARVGSLPVTRVVPVNLDLTESRQVPEHLMSLQWV